MNVSTIICLTVIIFLCVLSILYTKKNGVACVGNCSNCSKCKGCCKNKKG
ncbi:MAG: FeoB-associated Cys-rich membrane protein [Lachnospiraceae bacterium]|nr:FeoB-associated Cys-rich membrane protein [Lachnospiraceae bacterium]